MRWTKKRVDLEQWLLDVGSALLCFCVTLFYLFVISLQSRPHLGIYPALLLSSYKTHQFFTFEKCLPLLALPCRLPESNPNPRPAPQLHSVFTKQNDKSYCAYFAVRRKKRRKKGKKENKKERKKEIEKERRKQGKKERKNKRKKERKKGRKQDSKKKKKETKEQSKIAEKRKKESKKHTDQKRNKLRNIEKTKTHTRKRKEKNKNKITMNQRKQEP
jgi:hypothetical protein